MKAAFGFAFLSLSIVATVGCTTMEPRGEEAPQAQALTAEEIYMARIEQIARRRGVDVTWINLPKFDGKTPRELAQE